MGPWLLVGSRPPESQRPMSRRRACARRSLLELRQGATRGWALERRCRRFENGRVIFEPGAETLPREQLVVLQAERLRSLVAYVKERVPFYRARLAALEPAEIGSVDDLRGLPFTPQADLRESY